MNRLRIYPLGQQLKLVWLGLGLSLFFVAADIFLDVYIFQHGDVRQQLLRPEPYEIWIRLMVVAIILVFTTYAQVVATRLQTSTRQLEQELRQRQQTEEALQRYQLLAENTRDIILFLRVSDGRLLEANAAAIKAYGCERAELLSKTIYDLRAPETRHDVAAQLSQAGAGGLFFETLHCRQDGSLFPVEVSTRSILIGGDRILVSIIRDISARKQVEELHQQAEQRYRRLFEEAPVMYVITENQDGQPFIADCNQLFLSSLGYSRAEVSEQPLSRFYAPESRAQLLQGGGYEQALAGHFTTQERTLLTRDGRRLATLLQAVPETDPGGAVFGTRAMYVDITERKQAEARVQRLNRLYATLSQINQAIVRVTDRDMLFHEICRVAIEYGQFRMAWIGLVDEADQRVKPLAWAGEEQGYLTGVTITQREGPLGQGPTGTAIREERCVICQDIATDPRMRPWREQALQRGYRSSAAVPIRQADRVIGAFGVFASQPHGFDVEDEQLLDEIGQDVSFALDSLEHETRRRLAEAHLSQLNAELEQRVSERTRELTEANAKLTELDRLKDQFVSNVSHELRTPLANTKLYLNLLVSGKPDKREDYLQTLHREVGRLERMIEDLLDLSRLDQDAVPVQLVRLDLNQLLTQLVADRSPLANQRGLSLNYQANGQPSFISADPTLLTQVVSNLIANAISYTPRGGAISLHTAVHQQAAQAWTTITVCDSGPGISAADLPHLFERFYRGDAGRKTGAPGSGLGLAISKEFMEKMGGRISVANVSGQGAAFTVWLPTAPEVH